MFCKRLNGKSYFKKKKVSIKKHLRIYIVLAVLGVVIFLGIRRLGWGTTRTYNLPFSQAEAFLLYRLGLDENDLARPLAVQAKVDSVLAEYMSMKLYRVHIDEYKAGEHLSFTCSHRYNIGASGQECIHFDLLKRTSAKTRVTVDYCDRWAGMFPPFVFWNPGLGREKGIHNEIWNKYF